jgi:Tfp pilus assembly protein FimT
MLNKKPARSGQGFTMVEIAMVLLILILIAGMALPATSGLIARQRLRAQARALQDYAITARKLAVTEDRPCEIILNAGGFSLERMAPGEKGKGDKVAAVGLASNVVYTVQHWGDDKFAKPDGESWVFRPDGLCEPIRVHFENKDGWIEYTFNPLTARPRDETYQFP